MNKKKIIILFAILFFAIVVTLWVFIANSKTSNTVELIYGANTYYLEIYKDKIKVNANEEVYCIQAPCPKIKREYVIEFSKENLRIVKDFISDLNDDNKIIIGKENLTEEQMNIVDAIIQNDESLIVKGGK